VIEKFNGPVMALLGVTAGPPSRVAVVTHYRDRDADVAGDTTFDMCSRG
jgi:hypothetical protein